MAQVYPAALATRPVTSAGRLSLAGDVRALLTHPDTKIAVLQADGIVSAGPGILYGAFVVHPGATTPTAIFYDNASAASGRQLRVAAAAELVRGGWLWCGPQGIDCRNGIYLDTGGGTAPVLAVVFRGTYPTIAHAGTEMWFDGTSGSDSNDGLSIGAPRQTLTRSSGDFDSGDWRLYLKRGTTVNIPAGTFHDAAGTDFLVTDYGDASAARPILQTADGGGSPSTFTITNAGSGYTNGTHNNLAMVGGTGTGLTCNITVSGGIVTAVAVNTRGTGYTLADALTCPTIPAGANFACTVASLELPYLTHTATSGTVEWRNIDVRVSSAVLTASGKSSTGIAAGRGARLVADNCIVTGHTNGILWGGSLSRVTNCTAVDNGTGFYGGASGYACPSLSLVHKCSAVSPSNDALTLHDGNTTVVGNCVIGNTLEAGSENCMDLTCTPGAFTYTFLGYNQCVQGSIAAISIDTGMAQPTVIGNVVTPGPAAYGVVLCRGADPIFVGNYFECASGATNGGGVFSLASPCVNSIVLNNTIFCRGGGTIPVVYFRHDSTNGSGGVFRNNLVRNDGTTSTQRTHNLVNATVAAAWTINYNHYYVPNTGRFADGTTDHATFAAWKAAGTHDQQGDGGSTSGYNPNLTSTYKVPVTDTLVTGKGLQNTVLYLGLHGPINNVGQPYIGCYDPTFRGD